METIIYQIELNDGRIFRIFCASSKEKKDVINSYNAIKDKVKQITTITTGIHTTKQYKQILTTI